MKSNSRINKQEQVQVVIRLKPQFSENKLQRCAYLASEDSNALVVEVPNKKQYFVFDAIANQDTSQFQLYQNLGHQAVLQSLQGYNCCIFAYGQTGSGKTYSILGILQDIVQNIYTETRGILPRLLEDLFKNVHSSTDKFTVKCSYMEIYNEQIFDLLSQAVQFLQIREGPQKGVYVEGINNFTVTTYQEAVNLLLQGEKNRKIAETGMNKESSRSHTIFSINIESEIMDQDTVKYRKSKINIIDLAGSQRVKHTNVEGERLREGCNINKSLHVLGNVINALVESTKKKKHVPFRDSKLTYYLKDSLGGNSITKLLANIQCNSKFLGDTLSTLMFAKRAKILKMKVEVNQKMTQNYEALRKEIKKLRQELAQAKYINQTRLSDRFQTQNETELNIERFDTSNFQYSSGDKPIHIFEENELHYKALIQIYEEHMRECTALNNQNFNPNNNSFIKKKTSNILSHSEWKKLEKKNMALMNLIKRMPAFTKIYRENQLLKQERNQSKKEAKTRGEPSSTQYKIPIQSISTSFDEPSQLDILQQSYIPSEQQEELIQQAVQKTIEQYESVINEMKEKFSKCLNELDHSYSELEKQVEEKDRKIKEISKRQFQLPSNIQELIDENEYLKLNILELEAEISTLQKELEQNRIKQRQESRRYSLFQEPLSCKKLSPPSENNWLTQSLNMKQVENKSQDITSNDQIQKLIEKCSELQMCNQMILSLETLKTQAMKEAEQYQSERQSMIKCIQALQKQCITLTNANKTIMLKNQDLKASKNLLIQQISKKYPDAELQSQLKFQNLKSNLDLWAEIQKQKLCEESLQNHKNQLQLQIETLHLKLSEMDKIKQNLNEFIIKQKAIEKQFGKSINQILDDYAELIEKSYNNLSLSAYSRCNGTASQKMLTTPRSSRLVGPFYGVNLKNPKEYRQRTLNFQLDGLIRKKDLSDSQVERNASQEKNLVRIGQLQNEKK